MFYDLQIWNVSPPSCLRLDHAQRVRRTYQHSCPDTTLAYKSGFELENNTISLRLTVETSLKGKEDTVQHPSVLTRKLTQHSNNYEAE